MIDVHTHILNGLDDGVRTLEKAKEVLDVAKAKGIKEIILTPHYIEGSKYSFNNEDKIMGYRKLDSYAKSIGVTLYLGNEIYLDEYVDKYLQSNKVMTLNNSSYVLIELPLEGRILNLENILHELKVKKYKAIIAHPERCEMFQKDNKLLEDLYQENVLFQGNIESIMGKYGKKSKKLFKYMLKKNYYFCLASDAHNEKVYEDIETIIKKILKRIKNNKLNELININPKKIIRNE